MRKSSFRETSLTTFALCRPIRRGVFPPSLWAGMPCFRWTLSLPLFLSRSVSSLGLLCPVLLSLRGLFLVRMLIECCLFLSLFFPGHLQSDAIYTAWNVRFFHFLPAYLAMVAMVTAGMLRMLRRQARSPMRDRSIHMLPQRESSPYTTYKNVRAEPVRIDGCVGWPSRRCFPKGGFGHWLSFSQ